MTNSGVKKRLRENGYIVLSKPAVRVYAAALRCVRPTGVITLRDVSELLTGQKNYQSAVILQFRELLAAGLFVAENHQRDGRRTILRYALAPVKVEVM